MKENIMIPTMSLCNYKHLILEDFENSTVRESIQNALKDNEQLQEVYRHSFIASENSKACTICGLRLERFIHSEMPDCKKRWDSMEGFKDWGDNMNRDKFLTGAMGECWHVRDIDKIEQNTDYSTWEGFGKLWEWVKGQKWFDELLIKSEWFKLDKHGSFVLIHTHWIKPDRFADAIHKFLMENHRRILG